TVSGKGKLCIVKGDQLTPCVGLPYVPSGVGLDRGKVFVADSAKGVVIPYKVARSGFTAGTAIDVGKGAGGLMPVTKGLLLVPVKSGLAVVDTSSGEVKGTVELPSSPGQIAVANGKAFVPLPAAGKVAIVDPTAVDAAPTFVDAGEKPYAAVGAGP